MAAMLLLLLACAPTDPASSTDDSAPVEDLGPQPAPLAEVSSGACPVEGARSYSITSNGVERSVYYYMPENPPAGLPVLFYFHPLGGTASQMNSYLDLQGWAEENQVIVIAPNAQANNTFEWDFWNGKDDDLVLYDDLRSCAVNELGADVTRMYASGMSAGGLWTSFLGTRRGDTLASILPFSGGDGSLYSYQTPAYQFPVLLAYGGDADTWGGGGVEVDFQAATLQFAAELDADGHDVVLCNHNGGHTLPRETMDITTNWLLGQVYGQPSPFAEGLSGFPDWCEMGPEPVER